MLSEFNGTLQTKGSTGSLRQSVCSLSEFTMQLSDIQLTPLL